MRRTRLRPIRNPAWASLEANGRRTCSLISVQASKRENCGHLLHAVMQSFSETIMLSLSRPVLICPSPALGSPHMSCAADRRAHLWGVAEGLLTLFSVWRHNKWETAVARQHWASYGCQAGPASLIWKLRIPEAQATMEIVRLQWQPNAYSKHTVWLLPPLFSY